MRRQENFANRDCHPTKPARGHNPNLGRIGNLFTSIATMKSFFASLVVTACAVHEGAAFSALPSASRQSSVAGRRPNRLHLRAAAVGSSSPRGDPVAAPPRAPTVHEKREMDTIRQELVAKYVKLGHTPEYAQTEVNFFLEDPERSAQYVEMRRVAMARGNDLGIESFVQFAAAFLVGMAGSWMLNSWHAIQVRVMCFCLCRLSTSVHQLVTNMD